MVDLASLRVCFLAGCLGRGGAERQLFYILRALCNQEAKPRLLSLTKDEYWEGRIRRLGVEVTWVGRQASKLCRLARIVAALRKQKPDIIHSQHFFTNVYAAGAARILRIREIGAIRSDVANEVRDTGAFLGRLSLWAPRDLAANSRRGIENAVNFGVPVSRLKYLPNIVDTDVFRPASRPKPDDGYVRILYAGRLAALKRIDVVLETVGRLRKDSPATVVATIAGDGPERANLERRAVELGLFPGVVEFRDAVSDMAPVYREADALVLTSEREGTPNVLLEAMACGLPVVATRVGGVPEIVQDGVNGYVVQPGDPGMLTDRVSRLCRDPGLRAAFGRCGRQYVLANHAPSQLPRSLQELYEAVLS